MKICSPGDAILLLEDGVLAIIASAPTSQQLQTLIQEGTNVFALAADVAARGLNENTLDQIEQISYDDFVQLTIQHHRVQSWF